MAAGRAGEQIDRLWAGDAQLTRLDLAYVALQWALSIAHPQIKRKRKKEKKKKEKGKGIDEKKAKGKQ